MNDKRALRIWQQVLDIDPKNFLAHAYIGWEAAKSGDKDKALLMSKRAEEFASSVIDVFELGRLYHESEEFQSAINKYLEAKKLGYKDQGSLHAAIADCYLSLEDASQARKYAELAMSSKPENCYVKDVWQKCQGVKRERKRGQAFDFVVDLYFLAIGGIEGSHLFLQLIFIFCWLHVQISAEPVARDRLLYRVLYIIYRQGISVFTP